VILETLFGEGNGPKILLFLVVALGLLALAFWLVRRFAGGRLGSAATRGRQPRLAVIDQAAVDGRRRLVLIRRDNVEHLLIIGGPTDVVVEPNILRAATAQREAAPVRPAAAADTLPRAVPLGDDTMWPLQPEPAPKPESAPRPEPPLRTDGASRPPRAPAAAEDVPPWPAEPEAPALPGPPPTPAPSVPASAPAARRPGGLDPLAGLAEELSRMPAAEAANIEQRLPPRRTPRLPSTPSAAPTGADAVPPAPPADQNLSEMAQRLEAALRRPGKPGDKPAEPPPPTAPAPPEPDPFAPRPRSARLDSALRRPFKADDLRAAAPAPRPAIEPGATATEEGAPAGASQPDSGEPARTDAKPKSLYDSLEQEMASLLNRPTPKP
jgi:flagellar biogenesis protein FliO